MLNNAQLILFFDVYNIVKQSNVCHDDSETHNIKHGDVGTSSTEQEVQTELHPIPFNKDKNYAWNLWDLRRKAVLLVN